MSLWFEIAALVVLVCIAVAGIDICFQLESINRNFANLGTRLETEGGVVDRLETVIRERG
jgi:hypothetical protein